MSTIPCLIPGCLARFISVVERVKHEEADEHFFYQNEFNVTDVEYEQEFHDDIGLVDHSSSMDVENTETLNIQSNSNESDEEYEKEYNIIEENYLIDDIEQTNNNLEKIKKYMDHVLQYNVLFHIMQYLILRYLISLLTHIL